MRRRGRGRKGRKGGRTGGLGFLLSLMMMMMYVRRMGGLWESLGGGGREGFIASISRESGHAG